MILLAGGIAAGVVVAVLAAAFGRSSPATHSLTAPSPSAAATCTFPTIVPPKLQTQESPCTLATLANITPPASAGPLPTPVPIENTEEAIRVAASRLIGGGTTVMSQLESVVYVETTAGEARRLFSPNRRRAPEVPDNIPVWAFVAYGRFQYSCMGCGGTTSPVYPSLVVVVPKDGQRVFFGGGDEQYDLSQLGTPRVVSPSLLQEICSERISPSKQATYCGVFAPPTAVPPGTPVRATPVSARTPGTNVFP